MLIDLLLVTLMICMMTLLICMINQVVHLILWGSMDAATDKVSMTVGVAGSTLCSMLGLTHLPPGYCLPLDLTGTAFAPALELSNLSRRLAR